MNATTFSTAVLSPWMASANPSMNPFTPSLPGRMACSSTVNCSTHPAISAWLTRKSGVSAATICASTSNTGTRVWMTPARVSRAGVSSCTSTPAIVRITGARALATGSRADDTSLTTTVMASRTGFSAEPMTAVRSRRLRLNSSTLAGANAWT